VTPPGGWRRALLVGLAVVAVATAAVFANLALLDAAGEERLGRLNQSDPSLTAATAPAGATAPRTAGAATTAPATTAPSTTVATDTDDHSGRGGGDDDHDDDDSGRHGRGGDDDD
jgi:hypothetical protein